ncbi:hypothetical protein [Jatrophihabitans endophyticus]|uniref:hypothetical protein n=1 Tax=Jatrophihabitans endophyticus TaxID=1206085 RepID=UPI0019EBCF40|nr:hypothetical protein [Jatrophihabitans endophyticus]MBE7189213.1 hypothetical protein [Jatrophihabitans endophyticus]
MYDRLVESRRLIAHGLPDERVGLSRRRRFQPIAVNVDGVVAVTEFLTRAHGGAQWDTHLLERRDGEWRLLGGGSGGGRDYAELLTAPVCAELTDHHRADGGAGSSRSGRLRPGWVSSVHMSVCEHVAAVRVARRRTVPVPWHRRVSVVWDGRSVPRLELVGHNGDRLSEVRPDR